MGLRDILASLAAISLVACASDRVGTIDLCADPASGWEISPEAPAIKPQLLGLESGGQPVREQLRGGVPLTEIWFSEGPDRLMICRYEAEADVCPVAITVEFTRASNGWSAGPVESRICR